MKILLLESFYASSHKQWADGLISSSNHYIELLSLPGRHWKWRMHHAGKYFAYEIVKLKSSYDMILCSDMMNVAEFRGLLSALGQMDSWFNSVPIITYFHENQITYPWSENDPDPDLKRDNHYGWINYVSCLSSDYILFNSNFHKNNFIKALPTFMKQFPHVPQNDFIDAIAEKSIAIPVGLDLKMLATKSKVRNKTPIILWNHRWEFDKNPRQFFNTLIDLKSKNIEFELIIAGESYNNYPKIFDEAKNALSDRIIHFGFVKNRGQYIDLLLKSDILPVTSNQDFFGISVIEAIAAGCTPLLPNRLAFPEHLEKSEFQNYYYNSPVDLNTKLSKFIEANCSSPLLRKHILKYDLNNIGPVYDEFFNQVNRSNSI
jgi:glycosyltransferase involved in cell wall biosynthesis